ncbi:malonate--CoA ligase ACSF3, mitochondrial-like [Drosophila miranda]|uniref:malonate--CoA ligase ACSF3, mitochondrial-like n=1 Tax=Drosophila miranda TaxID=7229 RepID=UPI00143F148B|nr:malonate--CoA ligase ACSF3, mitochondrial-like [Drosophila miranda]
MLQAIFPVPTHFLLLRKSFKRGSKLLLPTFKMAMLYPDDLAIRDNVGEYTYFQLYMAAKRLSIQISNICGSGASLPVGLFCANDAMWIVMLWSCWMSGQVAVPLRTSPSLEMLRLQAIDCKAKLFLGTPENASIVDELAQTLKAATIVLDHDFVPPVKEISSTSMYAQQLVVSGESGVLMPEAMLPNDFYENSIAMLLYKSTSTSNESHSPKPVLLSHRNVDAQIHCLINTWRLGPSDTLLPVLPMVHMHRRGSSFPPATYAPTTTMRCDNRRRSPGQRLGSGEGAPLAWPSRIRCGAIDSVSFALPRPTSRLSWRPSRHISRNACRPTSVPMS